MPSCNILGSHLEALLGGCHYSMEASLQEKGDEFNFLSQIGIFWKMSFICTCFVCSQLSLTEAEFFTTHGMTFFSEHVYQVKMKTYFYNPVCGS